VKPDPFRYDLDDRRGVLTLHGELEEVATVELRELLTKITGEFTTDLAIDLADVSFMPSAAIGVLASSREKARQHGASIVLVAPAGTLTARLLTICALDHVESLPD
jgi:anti-anti-sigma factor